jgi:pyruvate/2-oxoglutarate dehydrogenase complex dihydrolipoamide acyltransferase (E2) component
MVRFGWSAALLGALVAGGAAHAQGYSVVAGEGRGADAGTAAAPTTTAPTPAPAPANPSPEAAPSGVGEIRPARGGRTAASRPTASSAPRHPWDYGGIVPGREVPPGLARRATQRAARQARVVVAWPGFQTTPHGSRIFLAVTATPTVVPERAPGRLIYRLRNAAVPVSNNRRPLITSAFETPVERAYLRPRGRDVDLVIELRAPAEPTLSQQTGSDGLQYLFLDFARWTPPNHVPAPAREGIRPAAPVVDEERPPAAQP